MGGHRFTDDEIAFYAREVHVKGKTIQQVAFENGRCRNSVAKHVWHYLRALDYKL